MSGLNKNEKRIKRKSHVRKNILGTTQRPRMSVFRTNNHIYVQIINDEEHKTIVSASDVKIEKTKKKPIEIANEVGKVIGEAALKNNVTTVVFDRGGYKYHGRVKALADGAREAGLKF